MAYRSGSDGIVRPTRAEVAAAAGRRVPDLIDIGLDVLFCGINPGLYSGATRHHFARPGNRFWPALHAARFTPRVISPFEEKELLDMGYGITNVISRATAAADELARDEFPVGARKLEAKIKKYQPQFVAILGVGAYRMAFNKPKAKVGKQEESLGGATVWVLPNPSGLNANYQSEDLKRVFSQLYAEIKK